MPGTVQYSEDGGGGRPRLQRQAELKSLKDSQAASETTDIRQYVEPIRSRWWLILAVAALATAGTYFYFDSKPREYTATTDVYVRTSPIDRALFGGDTPVDPDRNTNDQAKLLKSRTVAEQVAQRLDSKEDPASLLSALVVKNTAGSDFVTINATRSTPAGAARLANAFATEFIRARRSASRGEISAARQVAEEELSRLSGDAVNSEAKRTLNARIRRLRVLEGLPTGSAEQVDKALPPGSPSAPKPRRNALFAFFVSLAFAIGAAFALHRVDRRVRRVEEIEALYDLPILANVAHTKRVAPDAEGKAVLPDDLRESFRTLRTNLELMRLDRPLRTILVTSAVPKEGKSSVVRNLALAYREAGARVAIVEADMRQPTMDGLFHIESTAGLTNVLTGETRLSTALLPVPTGSTTSILDRVELGTGIGRNGTNGTDDGGHVALLASGRAPANPPAVLASSRVRELLREIAATHDLVLIDSPPILAVSDAIPLLTAVDGTIIVARLGLSTRDAARRVMELVRRVHGVDVLGVVANDVDDASGHPYPYRYA
jgi:Mrp family chromosome partitioning ATPase/capsular polysaccharide biosynthesis protein